MKISWLFDVLSPFSYLGLKQLHRLPNDVEVDYVPVLFAGLLNHHGQIGNAEIESKRRFTYRFCLWKARQLGIPMQMPPTHPFNPLMALRLIIACGSTRHAVERVFDAVFRDGQDVSDPNIIASLATDLGIADAREAINQAPVKEKLRANTEWAIAHGVFGVPTIVIDKELFWGHDALEMAIDYLVAPSQFEDGQMKGADILPIGVTRARRE